MKFSKVVTWFLSCVVLLLGAVSVSAATTVRGTKSNGSAKAAVCKDLACCKANPNAKYSDGQPCSAVLKNSGHASEKTTTVNTSKSNTYKEAEPTPAASTTTPKNSGHASEKTTTINSTKGSTFKTTTIKSTTSNTSLKEAEPTPAALAITAIKSTKSNASEKTTTIKSTKSNGSLKEAAPATADIKSTTSNTSLREVKTTHSNTYKGAEPTPGVTPTPKPEKIQGL
jgi:hypothetical protein